VIGLAVGIPIAILTLIGIGIASVYWMMGRKKIANENIELPERHDQEDQEGQYGDVDAVRAGNDDRYSDVNTVRQGNDAADSTL
jgi:hypothetical protein